MVPQDCCLTFVHCDISQAIVSTARGSSPRRSAAATESGTGKPLLRCRLELELIERCPCAGMAMTFQHGALIRFVLLYAGLFSAFGLVSPFLPAFLASRGLPPEDLGLVLGAGTAVRLVFGPFAGRLADRFHAFRAELAMSAILAAMAVLSYFAVGAVWMVVVVSLFQAAALAPLVPLADALSLAHARRAQDGKPGGFEYGWVRGAGSAAFDLGTLLAGQVAGIYGLSTVIWLGAVCLLAASMATILVPAFPADPPRAADADSARVPWRVLFRRRAFVRVVLIAALVHGSHAMYDSFAVIRWTDVGIAPATTAVLWSESVAAEVLVFLFLGPRLLRLLNPAGALAVSAGFRLLRFGGMGQTARWTAPARGGFRGFPAWCVSASWRRPPM